MKDSFKLDSLATELMNAKKKECSSRKPDDRSGSFQKASRKVNYIFGGSDAYEGKRKQKLTHREVMIAAPSTPEYLPWSEVSISFDRRDHPDFIPRPGRYPLLVSPTIRDVKLNRVLVDGGSSLNILFLKTFDQMDIPRSKLRPSTAPFHGVIPGASSTPIGQITLPVTFGTPENYRTEYMQFEVAEFQMAYNAVLGWSGLTKLMAVPHYAYLVLKMPGPSAVITLHGNHQKAYQCERESCNMADTIIASLDLARELENSARDSDPPAPKEANTSITPEETITKTVNLDLEDPAKVTHMGTQLDPK